ncbi:beta-1,3-galactosyl-O-glycosyl-glycoprotein beta-1,6-N-acetylglucosaminyltransferase-like [Coregonus clupeaformis]|uniref:beta-1,3-galactosyl-O-glycosyl-glycoprotein beta-1,6-N-acetylglucosaminyltransferase-like n=1 Tax=Coregonus clupeaformis TaxID=59861 RepID=UPI001E1C7010|nr:beta-1,3-galactosyl-O-glycosyl-glycoprotein beta-1,6-N-acetylglucosaminyltransferase-like [Coregonus clupeaformis]
MALRRGRRLSKLLLSVTLVFIVGWMLIKHGPVQVSLYDYGYSRLEYSDANHIPQDDSDCSAILQGDMMAIEHAKVLSITSSFLNSTRIPDEHYLELTRDCQRFRSTRKYLEFHLSREEEDFPLAFSLVVHHKVQNFERLLRAIYAPQNFYCIHVDMKAKASVLAAIIAITSCFENVFLASHPVSVVYASWSRVQADINCMSDLYRASPQWKYFINLCGQDFPIKTNLEMVRSLRALAGGNSMESEVMPSGKKSRWKKVHQVVDGKLQRTEQDKAPPPFGIPIFSGGAYIVVNRGFVRAVLEDSKVLALIQWANDTWSPDEFLWATIQRLPGVPGSMRPSPKFDMTDMHAISRLVKWPWHEGEEDSSSAVYPPCHGIYVRSVCVYGAGDLQWMLQQHHLFANKFDTDTDPIAIRCLEEHLRHKALEEIH